MKWPLELYIAARYIFHNLRQSLIVMLAVGMGVSIIIFIPSVNLSFFDYFLRKTVHNAPHIQVTRELETEVRNQQALVRVFSSKDQINPPHIIMTDLTLTRRRNIMAYDRLIAEMMEFPGVVAAAPYIKDQVIINRGGTSRAVDLNGIVPEKERQISDIAETVTIGSLDTLTDDEVFLGYLLADTLGVGVGNRVQVVTPYGKKNFKVAGLIDSGQFLKDHSYVATTLEGAQQILNLPNEVTGIGLKVREIYDAEKIAKMLRATFPVKTRSWMEDNRTILDQIANFRGIIAVISFLIVMAAASSITSILIMVVASKSREIGILKAMGTPPQTIMGLFVSQAVFLSILGAMCGVVGGFLLIQVYNLTPMAHSETFLGISREPVTMNMEYMGYAILYSIGSSILASFIPAWQASRLDPVKAING